METELETERRELVRRMKTMTREELYALSDELLDRSSREHEDLCADCRVKSRRNGIRAQMAAEAWSAYLRSRRGIRPRHHRAAVKA